MFGVDFNALKLQFIVSLMSSWLNQNYMPIHP